MLRKYKKPMIKDTVAAMFAKEYNAESVFFNASNIDFTNKKINGLKYEKGNWIQTESDFPNVVYNDIPLKNDIYIYNKLEKQGIPFTTHRLAKNKLSIYKIMKENEVLSKFLIDTFAFESFNNFNEMLQKYETVFLKPNRGHKGLGMFIFEKLDKKVKCQDSKGIVTIIPENSLDSFLSNIKDIEFYHIQPRIKFLTSSGNPYVIRSYVSRDKVGEWVPLFHYAAIGEGKNSIVNVSLGSSISYITPFLKNRYGEEQGLDFKRKLNAVAVGTARQIQKDIDFKIDALGIDLGIDEENNIFIIEVNAFPGTRPFEALVEKHAIPYSIYLAKNKSNKNS